MRHNTKLITPYLAVLSLFFIAGLSSALGDEPVAEASRARLIWAQPVDQHQGLGKLLGKTMKTVSHKGAGILRKARAGESTDKGAPETPAPGLFDATRGESPIRTARLFTIQINPPVAVATPAN